MIQSQRKVFRLTDAKKEEIPFFKLKKSDIFMMEEPSGMAVTFLGKTIFLALSTPYYNDQCIPEIKMKNYEPIVFH